MIEKIKEVQDYFLQKIQNGDYQVTESKLDELTILIDNDYKFKFYVTSFTLLQFAGIVNLEGGFECIRAVHNKEAKKHKLAEIEKLQQQLNNL